MAMFYRFRCSCGREWESQTETDQCPGCNAVQKWFGMRQVNDSELIPVKGEKSGMLIEIPIESSDAHNEWFNSDETKKRLGPGGDLHQPSKGSDEMNRRITHKYR